MTTLRPPLTLGALAILLASALSVSPVQADPLLPPDPVTIIGSPPEAAVTLLQHAHITIHRFPSTEEGGGLKLLVAPPGAAGWICRDDLRYAFFRFDGPRDISGPNPSVTCWLEDDEDADCVHVTAGGYHARMGSGSLYVTSACASGPYTQARLQLPFSDPGASSSAIGVGTMPWTCSVNEDEVLSSQEATDWWVFCEVNP